MNLEPSPRGSDAIPATEFSQAADSPQAAVERPQAALDPVAGAATYPPNCYFGFVCEACAVKGYQSMEGHIYFAHVAGREVPDGMRKLRDEIEAVSSGLLELFKSPSHPRFRDYFTELLGLARMGLVCDQANPSAAADALENLKRRIERREGKTAKSKYLNKLMGVVATFGAIFWVAGLLTNYFTSTQLPVRPGNYLYMLAAAMPAVWLSYASRKLRFRFEDLIQPEDDQMGPVHRVIYVVGFTLILALLGYLKVAGVFLGDFSTQDLGKSIPSALVFGAVCGLSESLLATTVAPHVSRIMTGLSQPGQGSKP